MGLYSNSVHSVQDVPEGATVSIPNDPTNGGRALVLLAKAGLITLKDGVGFKATVADITSNPKNIKIQELEAAQLPRSLDDVTIAVIPMNYVQSAGLSVEKQGFFFESKDEPLTVIVLAVRSEDKDNETYKKNCRHLLNLLLYDGGRKRLAFGLAFPHDGSEATTIKLAVG